MTPRRKRPARDTAKEAIADPAPGALRRVARRWNKPAAFVAAAFFLGLVISPTVTGKLQNLSQTAVSQETFCHPDGAPCLYARFERIGSGVNAATYVFFHTRPQAARRGLASNRHIACVPAASLSVAWPDRGTARVTGPEECWAAGSLHQGNLSVAGTLSRGFEIAVSGG